MEETFSPAVVTGTEITGGDDPAIDLSVAVNGSMREIYAALSFAWQFFCRLHMAEKQQRRRFYSLKA